MFNENKIGLTEEAKDVFDKVLEDYSFRESLDGLGEVVYDAFEGIETEKLMQLLPFVNLVKTPEGNGGFSLLLLVIKEEYIEEDYEEEEDLPCH